MKVGLSKMQWGMKSDRNCFLILIHHACEVVGETP